MPDPIISSESGALERQPACEPPKALRPFDDMEPYGPMMEDIKRIESLQAKLLGDILIRRFAPKSVIDVGCGPGIYLLPFKDAGARVFGVDGCETAGEFLDAKLEFRRVDLRLPFVHPRRYGQPNHYDLGLCIEVAEHLKPEYADTLVASLVNCCRLLFFTAARPGQPGGWHYNCQPMTYWLEKFSVHGWGKHPDSDDLVREIGTVEEFRRITWLPPNSVLLWREK